MIGSGDFPRRVVQSIRESISAKKRLLGSAETVAKIARASEVLIESLQAGYKVPPFGNGGSAVDAQHIAAEFVFDRSALPALALSVNTSSVTAIGNGYGLDLSSPDRLKRWEYEGMLRYAFPRAEILRTFCGLCRLPRE